METTSERDERVMKIVAQARGRSPAEREDFLRLECDPDLHREIAETLDWEGRMGSFLQEPLIAFTVVAPPFQPADVIEGRFEIVRVIGEGGMGIVYEAIDRKRNQRIAIKAAKPGFQRLLSPELEGALKVRHPNICLVNQIHTTKTENGEVDFLAMEFLQGDTLSAHLAKTGRLGPAQALDIARQLSAGLSEAHRSGIIHGDLKSSNIILCRNEAESLRPVITDFGLASGVNQPSGEFGGTPAYMAPELWRGSKASRASDIYALGVILYEMVTGRQPFENKSIETRLVRPPAPSTFAKGLDPRWDRVILDCLSETPVVRPPDAKQIIARLEKRPIRKAPLIVAGALAVAALTPAIRERVIDLFLPAHVRLAILPFQGPAEATVIGEGALQDVSDRLRHMPSARRTLVVISPTSELRNSVQTPEQAAKILHATHALQTTVHREGNEYIAQASVIDLDTMAHLGDFSARYSKATIGAFPLALAGEVSLGLHLPTAAAPEVLSAEATPPYDKGLYLLRTDEQTYENAIALFREAASLDPHSPLPPAALVEALLIKYNTTKDRNCLEEAQQALRAAESLNPDSARVRFAGGRVNKVAGQYQKALEDFHRVQVHEPRNIEVLLQIASVYYAADMPDMATDSYHKAIQLDPGYYKSHEQLGAFYYFRGNYSAAAAEFREATHRAPGRPVAYSKLGAALMDLGRYDEAEAALLESLKLRETAAALNNLGATRVYQRRDSEAVEYFERAVKMDPNNYVNIVNLSDVYRRLGRQKEASAACRLAMKLSLADLAENPAVGYPRSFVAYCAARLGDSKRAEAEVRQALKSSPGDNKVIENAILTYEVLNQRDKGILALSNATPELLLELERYPDLADFCQDPRFQELIAKTRNGGK